MSLYHYSNNNPSPIGESSKMSLFLKNTALQIHGLGLFREVSVEMFKKQTLVTPKCIISPSRVEEEIGNSNQAVRDMRYVVDLKIALKTPKEEEIMKWICYLQETIEELFVANADNNGRAILFTTDISSHYDTRTEPTPIEAEELSIDDVLSFGIGINIVYYVWKPRI